MAVGREVKLFSVIHPQALGQEHPTERTLAQTLLLAHEQRRCLTVEHVQRRPVRRTQPPLHRSAQPAAEDLRPQCVLRYACRQFAHVVTAVPSGQSLQIRTQRMVLRHSL